MTRVQQLSTLIVFVQNQPGVLYKIAGLIRRRRFNIESLTVSHTHKSDISRFTILVKGDKKTVEKMVKQLNRIVEVLKISTANNKDIIASELALIKVSTTKKNSVTEMTTISKHFRAKVVNITSISMTFEITGDEVKIDSFLQNMNKYGVHEFVRTGRAALIK